MTKLNTQAIYELAGFIASGRYTFNMNTYSGKPKCGTAGCVAGHGALLWNLINSGHLESHYVASPFHVAVKLGLQPEQIARLFTPGMGTPGPQNWATITQCMAVGVLQRLALTGEVKWDYTDNKTLQLLPEVKAEADKWRTVPAGPGCGPHGCAMPAHEPKATP